MFTHVMIGSNDLVRARSFYDATFTALGGKPGEMDARGRLIYTYPRGRSADDHKAYRRQPGNRANGGTIGIAAASPDHVLAWHASGIAHGGTAIESPPRERPNGSFVAYLRDPDGNKLTARSQPTR
ncbi:VOC family protein [Rhizobium laguerreae]|uniref:VOC family protein n=1 Tax=Rhizobium laguerreae TaxID=1076926 RepID=A0AB35FDT4_9HYPH|nr:VOC family protein [Rhizobium laguerreae]MBY3064798.1 VOC family protein [Rhizobium laguerreae]MBY3088947.1 VOC family protein [Rhizobium laguerreae]MBY3149274.1 VOC family protein [Rhizobium laguerreae]